MKTVHGSLITLAKQGQFDVIVHGCNCFHTMGAGIAKSIADEFPQALAADKQTKHGDRNKMGTYSFAKCEELTIVNAYTQFKFWGEGIKADYDAIEKVFAQIAMDFEGCRIGYPMIGAGLAGGDWKRISQLIETQLQGLDHTLVIYKN